MNNNEECFIKGRMRTGYAILMDIFGNKIEFKPIPKFNLMKRVSAKKTCAVDTIHLFD